MKKLSKEDAIRLHRALWKWIADESERRKTAILKFESPLVIKFQPRNNCFLCEYAFLVSGRNCVDCTKCPLEWGTEELTIGIMGRLICQCEDGESKYISWINAVVCDDWEEAARLALDIENLPERKTEEEK